MRRKRSFIMKTKNYKTSLNKWLLYLSLSIGIILTACSSSQKSITAETSKQLIETEYEYESATSVNDDIGKTNTNINESDDSVAETSTAYNYSAEDIANFATTKDSLVEASDQTELDLAENNNAAYDTEQTQNIGNQSNFNVTFIDVGQGDSSLIQCDGHYMLIDGGTAENSSKIYSILKQRNITHLDYIVCTHAHADHIGGLPGALNAATVSHALAPVTNDDNKSFQSFVKYLNKQNVSISVPSTKDTFMLGSAKCTILGPILPTSDNKNNTSIVIKVEYENTSFLFTGDAEREEEMSIMASGANLKSTVLKVGHHGSKTSTTYPFLREVSPEYAVISVGKGNSYGHPTEDVLSRLRDADVVTFRTDECGTIECASDGEKVTFNKIGEIPLTNTVYNTFESQKTESTGINTTTENQETKNLESAYLVLNTKTKKVHQPTCYQVQKMSDKNKEFSEKSMAELIDMGYTPAKCCN